MFDIHPSRRIFSSLILLAICLLGVTSPVASASDLPAVGKSATFDVASSVHDAPFRYTLTRLQDHRGVQRYALTYPSPIVTPYEQNNLVPGEYYLPADAKPGDGRPAVVVLHILGGNFELARLLCFELAQAGVPAMWFKLPYYGERHPAGTGRSRPDTPERVIDLFDQGVQDVRRACDFLASRPEVDPELLGITGVSMGGILSVTAAANEPRLQRLMPILAGGDLRMIFEHASETQRLQQNYANLSEEDERAFFEEVAKRDPVTLAPQLAALVQAGRVRMINASEDEVIPPASSIALAEALGDPELIVWLDGLGHYTAMAAMPQILSQVTAFYTQDLPLDVAVIPRPTNQINPQDDRELFTRFLRELGMLLDKSPRAGQTRIADGKFTVMRDGQTEWKGTLSFRRGAEGRFRLALDVEDFGQLGLGRDDVPWIYLPSAGTLLMGRAGERTPNFFTSLSPDTQVTLQVLSSLLMYGTQIPGALDNRGTLTGEPTVARGRDMAFRLKNGSATLRLLTNARGDVQRFSIEAKDVSVVIDWDLWTSDGFEAEGLFAPPETLEPMLVNPTQLESVYALTLELISNAIAQGSGIRR